MRFLLIISSFWALVASCAYAVSPPETFDLTATEGKTPVDIVLNDWLQKYEKMPTISSLDDKAFAELVAKQDKVTAELLKAARAKAKDRTGESIDQILKRLAAYTAADKAHELYPFILGELIESGKLSVGQRRELGEELEQQGGTTCPNKMNILTALDHSSISLTSQEDAEKMLKHIEQFQSVGFRRRALAQFLKVLPEAYRSDLASALRQAASPFEAMKNDNTWLFPEGGQKGETPSAARYWDLADRAVKHTQCTSAKTELLRGMKSDRKGALFAEAEKAARRVESCYRTKGHQARGDFWRSMTAEFKKSYGFPGEALAISRIASIYWGRDDFEQAKNIYKGLMAQAKAANQKEIEASSLFTLGRISENEGDFKGAAVYFEDYAQRFEGQKDYPESLKALVLLSYQLADKPKAQKYVDLIILKETAKPVDDRLGSVLSFALFWGGRIHLGLGDRSRAEALWQRGASEYFSTFYGALSHYVLERSRQVAYQLQPVRAPRFDYKKLRSGLTPADDRLVNRVEALLQVGLKTEASCELKEFVVDASNSQRTLFYAMLRHATGDWLESVKHYGELPKSYRYSLAAGFERLLFPIAYKDLVKEYSGKLSLDADFIFAIIRQESVFNPTVVSSAGARGLMQLMPPTAKMEMGRLAKNVLPQPKVQMLLRAANQKDHLFDPETNIILGSQHVKGLMGKYQSPVLVLTAYNASPNATERWKSSLVADDMLTFIERIPYRETNDYVKLVLRNYFYYKRWYQDATYSAPHLDAILPAELLAVGPPLAKKNVGQNNKY